MSLTASEQAADKRLMPPIESRLLTTLRAYGRAVTYDRDAVVAKNGDRQEWFGLVLGGEVLASVESAHGTPSPAEIIEVIAEEFMFDIEADHHYALRAATFAELLLFDREMLNRLRTEDVDSWVRLLAHAVDRHTPGSPRFEPQVAGTAGARTASTTGTTRSERDSLGVREISQEFYYGIQTLRAVENFPISGRRLSEFGSFVAALAMVKKAAARTNQALTVLDPQRADAIVSACDEIIRGDLRSHFVIDMVQGGAGTSTNMNANEVIANRALELLGFAKGDYAHLHPNDHVNLSQSTNDVYPTAMKVAMLLTSSDAHGSLVKLGDALQRKAIEFSEVLKMGRTENQDAVPMSLGHEFEAYAGLAWSAARAIRRAESELLEVNLGGTAIGTGLNAPHGYAPLATAELAKISGLDLQLADNLVESTQDMGGFVSFSAALKRSAISVSKICNDLRWLSSGPRSGLNEINLPPLQPGSSIMPGKVNPVLPEVVNQVCFQIVGYDATVSMAAEACELEINMAGPVIILSILEELTMLTNAVNALSERCVAGITANADVCLGYVRRSIGLVTGLNPFLGYERSSQLAKEALETGANIDELVVARGWMTQQEVDEALDPKTMTGSVATIGRRHIKICSD